MWSPWTGERHHPHSPSVAVFDFDKTLIDGDVAYLFMNTAIKASKVRRMAAGMLMPLLLPFLLLRPGRIVAVSVMLWIATFPLRGRTARAVFGAFATGVPSPPINARFYDEGMKALAAHRRLGHRLLIISGSPQELVRQVARPILEPDIQIIGSRIVPFLGGLIYRSYCMGPGKIKHRQATGRTGQATGTMAIRTAPGTFPCWPTAATGFWSIPTKKRSSGQKRHSVAASRY